MIYGILLAAALFALYGLLASRCDCSGPRCSRCPFADRERPAD
jgi:hypothetical protein